MGCVCSLYLFVHKQEFIHLVNQPLYEALSNFARLIMGCLLMVILALIPMVGYDVFWQIFSNLKKLRMSRRRSATSISSMKATRILRRASGSCSARRPAAA